MTRLYVLFAFMVLLQEVNAQRTGIKYYTGCTDLKNIYARKGDTIVFKCDSIRLLNRKAYQVLEDSYESLHLTSSHLATRMDSAGLMYKNLYELKTRDYEQVSASFEDFRQKTKDHILATDTNLTALRKDALESKMLMQKADNSIATSLEQIKEFERNKWKLKLKAGFVGFAVAAAVLMPMLLINN